MSKTIRHTKTEDRQSLRARRANMTYDELWVEALTMPRQHRAGIERRMREAWNATTTQAERVAA